MTPALAEVKIASRVAMMNREAPRGLRKISAAADREDLYAGQRLEFEFQRTASRLTEMQSSEYLHAEHLA